MAENERYKICVRKLNKRQDNKLLWFEVERGWFYSFTEAYNYHKNCPVYTIVDLQEWIRWSDNLIFWIYDYFSKKDCNKALKDLEKWKIEISHRSRKNCNLFDFEVIEK